MVQRVFKVFLLLNLLWFLKNILNHLLMKMSSQCNLWPIPLVFWGVKCLTTVFFISSSECPGLGGILLSSSLPTPSSRSVSFDWDNLAEPHLPFVSPFQIRVRVNSTNVYRCMVDEGSFVSSISSLDWKYLGSTNLLATDIQFLSYDRRPGESMGFFPQLIITLSGKNFLIDMVVVAISLYTLICYLGMIMCML